jgi:hypothetical protein
MVGRRSLGRACPTLRIPHLSSFIPPVSTWNYKLDDRDHGPVSFKKLAALVRDGKVSETTHVARAGTADWQPAWHVPGLFRAAGIAVEGESPPVEGLGDPEGAPVQGSGGKAHDASLASLPGYVPTAMPRPMLTLADVVRGVIATVVGVLAVGFFYRWAWQTSIAFPMPPKMVDGELIDCYFPLVGRCTMLECALLYLDVFGVAALATWYAARKNQTEK